jgi:hypothetical protein
MERSGSLNRNLDGSFARTAPARPWAKNWEKYFEVGWDKEILDLFKMRGNSHQYY